MASWDKIKVGNLYLYTMDQDADRHGRYVDVPVIALKRNENRYGYIEGNDEYPTWICLFPNLTSYIAKSKNSPEIFAWLLKNSKFSFERAEIEFKDIKNLFEKIDNIDINYKDTLKSRPIFIIGMPRSGTTLIEQILSSHSQIYGAGELDFLPKIIDKLGIKKPINLSIIGCVVNGPGEAAQTEIGLTGGGHDSNLLYLSGVPHKKVPSSEIIDKVVKLVEEKIKD